MSNVGKLRIKPLSELTVAVSPDQKCLKDVKKSAVKTDGNACDVDIISLPERSCIGENSRKAATGVKKSKVQSKTTKKTSRAAEKVPPSQAKIDSFFKSCSKTYKVEKISTSSCKSTDVCGKQPHLNPAYRGRKRLFKDNKGPDKGSEEGERTVKDHTGVQNDKVVDCIDLCSESGEEVYIDFVKEEERKQESDVMICMKENLWAKHRAETLLTSRGVQEEKCNLSEITGRIKSLPRKGNRSRVIYDRNALPGSDLQHSVNRREMPNNSNCNSKEPLRATTPSSVTFSTTGSTTWFEMPKNSNCNSKEPLRATSPNSVISSTSGSTTWFEMPKTSTRKKTRLHPPYKVIAGTTFAVDAFQFGQIQGVTHYFLTHFHADHYKGLTRSFAQPLVLSPVTAQLVRAFIRVEDRFLREIELNRPEIIDGVEVTAIDANHCPGAVMFVFKLPSGKCILHTGDFRASPDMESEPVFWNNDIDVIYLDTTYISDKYVFCTQDESIGKAENMILEFKEKHQQKKILYICGAYLIGKERFWSTIARRNRFMVWTDEKRRKALNAMQDLEILKLLCDDPIAASLHVISMGSLSYFPLVEYFESYRSHFDVCLAMRPSGWEKNAKPQYRGKINIVGIEYSEHSSYNELRRFVTYLRPQDVVSTVPVGKDLRKTSKVPLGWYKYDKFPTKHRSFQPSITNYLKVKTNDRSLLNETQECANENHLPSPTIRSDAFCEETPHSLDRSKLARLDADAYDDWLS